MPLKPRSAAGVARFCLATLAGLALLASCTPTQQQPTLLTKDQTIAEYQAETKHLQLPPGTTWPDQPLEMNADQPDYRYEPGVGSQGAQFHWYCSWATYGLAHHDAHALKNLETFTTMSAWAHIDDNGHALFNGIQKGIAAGDLDPLRDYVATNCAST